MDEWYLQPTGHGSRVQDIRYVWARGDRVRITKGFHAGYKATVQSRVAPQPPARLEPGYHVELDGGAVVTVGWDEVKGSTASQPDSHQLDGDKDGVGRES